MTAPPPPPHPGRLMGVVEELGQEAQGLRQPRRVLRRRHGSPTSRWVTFTVTTTGKEFLDADHQADPQRPGSGGLLTLKDSGWVISLSIFDQPEVLGQPPGTIGLVGLWALSRADGNFVQKAHG